MLYTTVVLIAGLAAAMEVTNEPVAFVLDYGDMQNITLKASDVYVFSLDIPQVKSVDNTGVVYAKRSMAEMVAANVPQPPPEEKPTLPNESRFKKRLDHTPPFTGTVTGDVSIVESAPNQRIVIVSNIQGDGIMQVLVKGNTAKTSAGKEAKPIMNAPAVVVRNTKAATDVVLEGATAKSLDSAPAAVRTALDSHFDGEPPANLRLVSQTVTVK